LDKYYRYFDVKQHRVQTIVTPALLSATILDMAGIKARSQISPWSVQSVAPAGEKQKKNRPLSKNNTGRAALRAVLPVKSH